MEPAPVSGTTSIMPIHGIDNSWVLFWDENICWITDYQIVRADDNLVIVPDPEFVW